MVPPGVSPITKQVRPKGCWFVFIFLVSPFSSSWPAGTVRILMLVLLTKHNIDNDNTWKQNFIGTRKYDSEASAKIIHNHATEDPDGSTKDDSSGNIQRIARSTIAGDEGSRERGDGLDKQHGSNSNVIEPRSYQDVLVNGGGMRQRFCRILGLATFNSSSSMCQ